MVKVKTNNKEEAIESNGQKKGTYLIIKTNGSIHSRSYYRVLKPGKWMTVEFSNTVLQFGIPFKTALIMQVLL